MMYCLFSRTFLGVILYFSKVLYHLCCFFLIVCIRILDTAPTTVKTHEMIKMHRLIFRNIVSHLEPNKTPCVTMETEAALNPSF